MKYAPLQLKYEYGLDLVEKYCPPNCGGPPRLPDGRVVRKEWKERGPRNVPAPRSAGVGKPEAPSKPKHEWKQIKAVDSQTIQQAKSELRKILPGVVVSTNLVDRPGIDKNLMRRATVSHLNAIGNESARLRNEFPLLDKILSKKGSEKDKAIDHISISPIKSKNSPSYSGAYGTWTSGDKRMTLSNSNFVAKGNGDKISIGSYFTCSSPGSVFRHELGHAIQDHIGNGWTKDQPGWASVMNSLPKNKAEQKSGEWFTPSGVKKLISKYAATNHREAFAESFAAYTSPNYASSAKKLPKQVEEFFDYHLKGVSKAKTKAIGWAVEPLQATEGESVSCQTCIHFDGRYACPAYPNGVPMSLYLGVKKHTQVLGCQDGELVWNGGDERDEEAKSTKHEFTKKHSDYNNVIPIEEGNK